MQQSSGGLNNHHLSTPKLERPNSLGGSNKISRRIVCYHGDHCKYSNVLNLSHQYICHRNYHLFIQHQNVVRQIVHLRRIQMAYSIIITKYKAIYYCPNCRSHQFRCPKLVRFRRRRCFQHQVQQW